MVYTSAKPPLPETPHQLRARIPGWGVDLDPADRPAVPRMRFDPSFGGAHWELPERQPEKWPRERSIEHATLTPVFGTSCPPKGLSGVMRKRAYRRYSEARAAHWLLLLAAARVDVVESRSRALIARRPDNPISESGVTTERGHRPVRSRLGNKRADGGLQALDPLVVAGPVLAAVAVTLEIVRRWRRRSR